VRDRCIRGHREVGGVGIETAAERLDEADLDAAARQAKSQRNLPFA
jgi:hypothetical protein